VRRWPILLAGLLAAIGAGVALLTAKEPGDAPRSDAPAVPHAVIGEDSRRALDDVIREGERLDEEATRPGDGD